MSSDSPTEPAAGTQFSYGVGGFAEGVFTQSLGLFLLVYYREALGLSGTFTGLALLIALLFDAVSDPMVGTWSDRLRTRLGRRHPLLYASALPLSLTYLGVFIVPDGLSEMGLFAWLCVLLVATRLSMTLFVVPHMALGAELAEDYRLRTRLMTGRMFLVQCGGAIAPLLGLLVFMRPTPEFEQGERNPAAYPPYAVAMVILMLIPMVWSTLGTHRTAAALPMPPAGRGKLLTSFMRDLVELLRIRNFRVHFFGSTVAFAGWGLMGTSALHMRIHFWHVDEVQFLAWGAGMTAGILLGLGFWAGQSDKLEKRDVFVRGLGMYVLCTAPCVLAKTVGVFPAEGTPAYFALYIGVVGFLAHFGIAGTIGTGPSMMADVADEDSVGSGQRRQGVAFGAVSFAAKAAMGVGGQLAGVLVDLSGLPPGAEPGDVGPEVGQRLGFGFSVTVIALIGGAVLIYRGYRLTADQHAQMRLSLQKR